MTGSGAAAAGKGLGAGKMVLIGVAVAVVGVGVATALGVMPVLSALAGTAKQRDLGVVSDRAAYESAMRKAGVQAAYPESPAQVSSIQFKGSKKLDADFTDAEVSALINAFITPFPYTVRGVQVRFHSGGRAEASAMVTYQGRDYPGYVSAPVSLTGGIVSSPGATRMTGAGISVPARYKEMAEEYALRFFNEHITLSPGLRLTNAELSEGKVHVEGTVPAEITFSR